MAHFETWETGKLLKILLQCREYVGPSSDLGKKLEAASQIVNRPESTKPTQPIGGSIRIICNADKDKLNQLWEMFRLS